MKIYGKCKNCQRELNFSSNSNTRVELAMNDGETIKLNCKSCGERNLFTVDEFYAKESKLAKIIAGLIFLIGTPFVLFLTYPILSESRNHYIIYVISGLLLFPVIVYAILKKQERTRINSFNRIKLKGRIQNIG